MLEVPRLARLARDLHKGERGRVLVVAGSLRMSGAARLSGWGAVRGGAGLVTIATPDVVQLVVAADLPTAITMPLPSRAGVLAAGGAAEARAAAAKADAVAAGPGLGVESASFLKRFLRGLKTPVVLDADALNVLAAEPALLAACEAPRVLTPHPGEAARLLGEPVGSDSEARVSAAEEIARRFSCTAVLKGAGTVVCDGERLFENDTGNPGMATGGTGDVLTGLLAARLAAGLEPFAAAVQAVHAHGRAGDLAAAAAGQHAMIATDVIASLPAALEELEQPRRSAAGGEGGSHRRGRRAR